MNQIACVFFGYSGSGKGTQVELLKKYLEDNDTRKVLTLSTGAIARDFQKESTFTAKKVKEVLDAGGLFPAFIPIFLWTRFLNENFTGEEHILLDGLARRVTEAPILANAFAFYGLPQRHVISLNISREEAHKRLVARGRYDDNEEDIKTRLNWYDENVVPSINYFRGEKSVIVHDIDGEGSVEEVQKNIISSIFAK
jgi:adenylate kinase